MQLAETLIRIQRNSYLSRDDQSALSHAADTLASLPLLTERKEPLSKDQIREVFLAHGFTVKDGQTDLKPYVYDAAYALIALVQQPTERKGERKASNWGANL